MSKSTQINKRLTAKIPTPGNEVTTLGTSSVQTNNMADAAVTNTKMSPMPGTTLKGNNTYISGSSTPSDLTIPQVSRMIPPPTYQKLISGTSYNVNFAFAILTGSATVGATYTHNSVTYTVFETVASANIIILSGNAAPLASGTLTKASGTGDTTLTFIQSFAPKSLEVQAVAAGGGGSGISNGVGYVAGGNGTATIFNGVTANAGGGSALDIPGAGGSAGAGTATYRIPGGQGNGGSLTSNTIPGGSGGGTFFGGNGAGGTSASSGGNGALNTGAGGGGSGGNTVWSAGPMSGGGGGEYFFLKINNPVATYTYQIGVGGAKGDGTSADGGVGADGMIIIKTEY